MRVSKKVENEFAGDMAHIHHEKFLACVSANDKTPRKVIRKTARLATHYNTSFIVLYVQTPRESPDRISLANQRYLSNHFKLATELGAEVIQIQSSDIMGSIVKVCQERQITTVCMGQPALKIPEVFFTITRYKKLIDYFSKSTIDLIIVA